VAGATKNESEKIEVYDVIKTAVNEAYRLFVAAED
jgi:hypothetical protein